MGFKTREIYYNNNNNKSTKKSKTIYYTNTNFLLLLSIKAQLFLPIYYTSHRYYVVQTILQEEHKVIIGINGLLVVTGNYLFHTHNGI